MENPTQVMSEGALAPDGPAAVGSAAARMKMSGMQKAATLLVGLGQERAAEVLKHIPAEEMEPLMVEVAKTQNVTPEQVEVVMTEVVETAVARGYFHDGGFDYARNLLEGAMGHDKAMEILSRLQAMVEVRPFRFLLRTAPDMIYASIRRENPQTIALVLAHLNEHQTAGVLSLMDPALQADIIGRMAKMKRLSPDLISSIEREMRSKMGTMSAANSTAVGGVEAVAKIINQMDRQSERNVFERLEASDEELASEIRSLMFVFEDITGLDNRAIQAILREADSSDLALAMRAANDELKEIFFANMSERAAETLREELELMPPKRRREVEEAQLRIVNIVRELEEKGDIVIARGGEEDELV